MKQRRTMRLKDMYDQPGYLIRRLHQRSTAEFARVTEAAGITEGAGLTQIQLSILLAIAEFPGTDATRISDLIGSDRATIGQALSRLEAKQLIRRNTGTEDKRTKELLITRAGEDIVMGASAVAPQIGKRLFVGLSPVERDMFLHLLAKAVAGSEGERAVGLIEYPDSKPSRANAANRPQDAGREPHRSRE